MRMNKTEDGGLRSTGISRPVDELGRIVLPVELRRSLDIKEGDRMSIYTAGNSIVLEKATPRCAVCGIENTSCTSSGTATSAPYVQRGSRL